jgi:integrase
MPFAKKSKPKAAQIVRHKLADGTIKDYRYQSYSAKPVVHPKDTLSALIDAYKGSPEWHALAKVTQVNYALYLRPLDEIGHIEPATLRRRDILAMRDAIASSRGNGAATGFVRAAGALFNWAVDRGWVDHNPVTKIRPLAGGELPAWRPEQARLPRANLPEHLRRVVILALYTGQRRGDLCKMGWSAYDGERIRLIQHKTKHPLVLPVHPVLKAELGAWRHRRTSGD